MTGWSRLGLRQRIWTRFQQRHCHARGVARCGGPTAARVGQGAPDAPADAGRRARTGFRNDRKMPL